MIQHTVAFNLKHEPGSSQEQVFFAAALQLSDIPGVTRFQRLRQVSVKNPYAFSFSMEFADQAAYDGYNDHPAHVSFVRDRWVPEVASFLEADYIEL